MLHVCRELEDAGVSQLPTDDLQWLCDEVLKVVKTVWTEGGPDPKLNPFTVPLAGLTLRLPTVADISDRVKL